MCCRIVCAKEVVVGPWEITLHLTKDLDLVRSGFLYFDAVDCCTKIARDHEELLSVSRQSARTEQLV